MAIKIKSADDIAKKFATVTPGRSTEYAAGIDGTSEAEYQAKTVASEANWAQAVQAAIAAKLFSKGAAKGGPKWKRNASGKGVTNYSVGVAGAAEDYATGFAPYQAVIANLTLPPKGPKGSPANIERVRAVAVALRNKKVAG